MSILSCVSVFLFVLVLLTTGYWLLATGKKAKIMVGVVNLTIPYSIVWKCLHCFLLQHLLKKKVALCSLIC